MQKVLYAYMKGEKMDKNLISILDITKAQMEELFSVAKDKDNMFNKFSDALSGKILASLFLQPSTRTQLSFQSAFLKLGGRTIGFSDINHSRSGPPYYEPLDDMGRIASNYCDIIVMRTINAIYTDDFISGATIPVISAGSGNIEHPTQGLTDLFTLTECLGPDLSGINVLIIGTPRQRTINSLLLGLSNWKNIHVHILCQNGVFIMDSIIKKFVNNINVFYYSSLDNFLDCNISHEMNVIYMDKIFNETYYYNEFVITQEQLYSHFASDTIVLHPLPRTKELPKYFDEYSGSKYFAQAYNGLYVRGALFLSYFIR